MKKSTNRVQLLKAVSVSVNEFYFSPSKVRKGKARKAINELLEFVESVELPKPQKKASVNQSDQTAKMFELFQQFLAEGMTFPAMSHEERLAAGQESASYEADLDKPKAKAKPKRRRKTTTKKATPQQRVADSQEKAFHGRPDSPVTPSKRKRTASVEEARKAAESASKANGATDRIANRAKARKAELLKAFQTKLDLEFPLDGPSNEVSFDDMSLAELAKFM